MRKTFPTILVTGARAPVALHLARLFDGAGHRVVLADTPARPIAAASRSCAVYRCLPPPRFACSAYADAVEKIIAEEAIGLVFPTCEEVFHLAGLWRDRAMEAALFAPGIDLLARVHDKHAFIRLAESFGLAVPATRLLRSRDDLEEMRARSRELVFKPVWSRFASQVLVRPAPRALAAISPTDASPWIAQEHVAGEEISAYAVAKNGILTAFSAYGSLYRAGKGAGVCFRPVVDAAVRAFVEAFVAGTGWTGQISFDFMREADGRVLPLECNPRATSGVHFFADPDAFAAAVLDGDGEVAPDVESLQGVRLALWLYGLPAALRTGKIGRFRATLRDTRELLDWPGDSGPRKAQFRALAEIARTALRERVSLQAASTRDIEWNGPSQSSI